MSASTDRPRKRLLIAAASAVLLLILVVVATRVLGARSEETAHSTDDSPHPSATISGSADESPSPSPERTAPVTPLSEDEAADTTLDALSRTASALSDPGNPADLSDVLTDSALDAYLAQAEEFMKTGVHQNGAPTIENARIIGTSDDGTSMEVEACVDSSSVQVVNDQGTDLRASEPKRSRTIFTLTNPDGSWKIASETFPEDPTC
ncbi:IMS domain-containing protein [Propionibacterium australiense]|uniref:DUF4101 domain-containing protein n=1 Tax=Propionibacterium australiense TaxID=119981 RepID=A0A383S630_9ACTN|nr:IMS domain-containing protein [Propionibacterium australiense]RLP08982.1 DUF4101 domain-containing protein [Propionibacterium australiense]RLP09083.1 DUF4101 domain-containing protein [Propionibacterium australiense]SYZ33455.1 Domain of unknown function DUF4101 [Propionibacterium australiense]VEH91810.1 Uncharacterised protein [Propionibacterium australiense]